MSIDHERFITIVQQAAGVGRETAERATQATLETLAERIAGGEVDDLISRLPAQLHEPLKRGKERSGGKAKRLPLR